MTEKKQYIFKPDELSSSTLNERIYLKLLDAIIEVKFKPGEMLNAVNLAKEMNISRSPIHYAAAKLMEDGLIRRVNGKGFQVMPISMSDCLDLCDARKILEGRAAYMAACSASREDIKTLEECVDRAKECLSDEKYDDFAAYDTKFHETLLLSAGNPYLWSVYKTIRIRINRYRYIISNYCRKSAVKDTGHALTKHICVLNAIKNRYTSVAEAEMEEHIAYTYRTLLELSKFAGLTG